MANDTDRQTLTDQMSAALQTVKDVADQGTAIDLKFQLQVGRCTIDLADVNPDELQAFLNKEFEPTP